MSRKLPILAFVLAFFVASLQAAPLEIAGRVQVPSGTVKGQAVLFPARSAGEEARLRLAGKADPPLVSAQILPDGGFELAAPEFGLYRVLVEAEGHLPMELYAAIAGDAELPEVQPEPARPVEILVLDPEGRPAAGVPLLMSSSSWADDPSIWPTGRHVSWRPADRYGLTREDGRLVLARSEKSRSFLWAPGAPSLDVSPEERSKTLRLPVRRPHRLVVRGPGGRPLADVLARSGRLPLVIGDDQGRIEVLAAEGERIALESLEGDQGWAELANARRGPQQVTLDPPRILKGRVLEAGSRSPLTGALVWMGGPPAARSTGGGVFELPVRAGVSGSVSIEGAALDHVAWGQHFPEGQKPVLLLWPAAEIRGSVTEAGGKPVAGAEISAIPADADSNRDLQREEKTRTAADGSFRLRGLFSGATYRLRVQRAGMAPAVRLADAGAAAPVHIVLSPGGRISGRILDEEGRPVAGARVIFSSTNEGDLDAWHAHLRRDPRFSRTTTDAEGRFHFADVRAGRFHLTMDGQGFLPESRSVEVPDPPRDVDLEVTLEAEAVLEGLVTDEQGRPLAGARVSSAPSDPASVPLERRQQRLEMGRGTGGQTGTDGRFRVEGLIRGIPYNLSVELKGYIPAKVSDIEAPARAPVRIEMKPAPSLTGRVVGSDGRPVAMANVAARREGDANHMPRLASASSDENGRFRLFFAAPGLVTLAAGATDYRTKIVRGIEVPAQGEVGPIEISLEPGAVLEGRVLDERGTPVPGAQVRAQSTGELFGVSEVWQASSGADGRYRLEGLDLGLYDVSATAGDRKARVSVDIGLSVQSLDLRLEEQASVSGRVTDAAGVPVPGAGVFLIPADSEGERAQRATSSTDGAFVFLPVSRGTYRLIVLAEGFGVSPPEEVRVQDRDLTGLDLRLSPGAVVSGRILGLAPEELPAVRIVAVREGAETQTHPLPGTFMPGTVARDGRYRILQLGAGRWRVIASLGSSQRKAEGRVDIASPGEEVDLDLSFGGEPKP